jgi:hypothetical protein
LTQEWLSTTDIYGIFDGGGAVAIVQGVNRVIKIGCPEIDWSLTESDRLSICYDNECLTTKLGYSLPFIQPAGE